MTIFPLRASSSALFGLALLSALALPACGGDDGNVDRDEETSGDGDGDPTGDGDGDPTTGDGDGDGDPTTGDGDGDAILCFL